MISQTVLEVEALTSFVTPEATGQDASSERHSRDDDDVERNADFSSGGTKKLISLASTLLLVFNSEIVTCYISLLLSSTMFAWAVCAINILTLTLTNINQYT